MSHWTWAPAPGSARSGFSGPLSISALLRFGIPLLAVALGILAGVAPVLAVAAALGIAYALLVFNDVVAGVILFAFIAYVESLGALGSVSLAKGTGALLALSWLMVFLTTRNDERQLLRDHPVGGGAFLLLAAWVVASAVWAFIPAVAIDSAQRWVLNLLLVPIVYTAIRTPQHVRWMMAAFIAGGLLSAALGYMGGLSEDGRLGGSGVNPNELGELLVLSVVFAATLAADRGLAPPLRLLVVVAGGLSLVALLLTGSRGASVGLIVAMLAAPVLVGPGRRFAAASLVGLVLVGAGTYVVFTESPAVARLTQGGEDSSSGRTDLWRVASRMVAAQPVTGVGAGNYRDSAVRYVFDAGAIQRSDLVIDTPKDPHNVYLQVLSELGVVGLALFGTILLFSLGSVARAARASRRVRDVETEVLARGLLIAVTGLSAALVFSTAIYRKQIWLLLALCVAMGAISRERARRSASA